MTNDHTRVLLLLVLRTSKGQRSDLLSFLHSAIPFYESPTGIKVRVIQSVDDPDRLIEMIEYDSWDKYLEDKRRVEHDEVMKGYLKKWRQCLDGPPRVEAYVDLSEDVRTDNPSHKR